MRHRPRKAWHNWVVATGAVLVIFTMTACDELAVDAHEAFASAREEGLDELTLDFDAVVSGAWDHLIIACDGATPTELQDALGFEWEDAPDVRNTGFLSSVVFVRGDSVDSVWSAGYDSDWEFTPCPANFEGIEDAPRVVSIPRDQAQVPFEYNEPSLHRQFWAVPKDAYVRLASLG